jgi:C4-type Zn-finger protein
MARHSELDDFICPVCGCDEAELEQEYDEETMELVEENIVCNGCGYVESLY